MFELKLLRASPQLEHNRKAITMPRAALDVLIYMAYTGAVTYERATLAKMVWGEDEDNSRKKLSEALYQIPKAVKQGLIVPTRDDIGFNAEYINVDAHHFVALYKLAKTEAQILNGQQAEWYALQALGLYEDDFLSGYWLQTGLHVWQNEMQDELFRTRSKLFELLVACKIQQRECTRAKHYAEQWADGMRTDYIALQYLIWISANQGIAGDNVELSHYLEQLEAYERTNTIHLGPTVAEWRQHLQHESLMLPAHLLRLRVTPDALEELEHVLKIPLPRSIDLFGREHIIDHIVQQVLAALSPLHAPRLALTGPLGIGKRTVLRTIAHTLSRIVNSPTVLYLQLTVHSTQFSILNDLTSQLIHHQTAPPPPADFASSYRYVQHALENAPYVLMLEDQGVDDGQVTAASRPDMSPQLQALVDYVSKLVGHTPILLTTTVCTDSRFRIFTLPGLTLTDTRALMTTYGYTDVGKDIAATVHRFTGGHPLLLRVLFNLGRIRSFSSASELRALSKPRVAAGQPMPLGATAAFHIREVLRRVLSYMPPTHRQLFQFIALFDPAYGVSITELSADERFALDLSSFHEKVDFLIQLGVVERVRRHGDQEAVPAAYCVRPWLCVFLQEMIADEHLHDVREVFVRVVLAYLEQHQQDVVALWYFQHNIVRVLRLIHQHEGFYCSNNAYVNAVAAAMPLLRHLGACQLGQSLGKRALEIATSSSQSYAPLLHELARQQLRCDVLPQSQQQLEQLMPLLQSGEPSVYLTDAYLDPVSMHRWWSQWTITSHPIDRVKKTMVTENETSDGIRLHLIEAVMALHQRNAETARHHAFEALSQLQHQHLDSTMRRDWLWAVAAYGWALVELEQLEAAQAQFAVAFVEDDLQYHPDINAYILLGAGRAQLQNGLFGMATLNFEAALHLFEMVNHGEGIALAHLLLGECSLCNNALACSQLHIQAAYHHADTHHLEWMQSALFCLDAARYLEQGNMALAERRFEWALVSAGDNPRYVSDALYGLVLSRIIQAEALPGSTMTVACRHVLDVASNYGLENQHLAGLTSAIFAATERRFIALLNSYPDVAQFQLFAALARCLYAQPVSDQQIHHL